MKQFAPNFAPNQKIAFRGTFWDTYQWEQKLFDGTTAIFEGVSRTPSAFVIAESDGKILYSRQEQPGYPAFFGCFGGVVDPGKTR